MNKVSAKVSANELENAGRCPQKKLPDGISFADQAGEKLHLPGLNQPEFRIGDERK